MTLELERFWRSQPPSGGINWGHPRARDLVFFAPLGTSHGLRDLVTGQMFTQTGLTTTTVSGGIPSPLFGTSSYADFTKPPQIGATTPFTVAWTQEPISGTGYSSVLTVNFGSGTNQFIIYLSASDATYNFNVGPRTPFASVSFGSIGLTTNGRRDRFVLQCFGGSQSTVASSYVLWRNGQRFTTSTVANWTNVTAAIARIGARDTGADPFEGALQDMRMWARVLTDPEAEAESRIVRAAELYEPRKLWLPTSVVGGGNNYTTTIVGSLTGSGYILRQTNRLVVGSSTGSNTLNKHTTKTSGGSSTPSGSGVPNVGASQNTSGSITLVGSLANAVTYVRNYASQIISSGSLSAAFSGLYLQTISGIITAAGAVSKSVSRLVTGSMTLTSALYRHITRTLSSTITGIGNLSAFKFVPTVGGLVNRGMRFMRRFIGRR